MDVDAGTLRIGIMGDFHRGKHSHWATEAALFHAAARLGLRVAPAWVGTRELALADGTQRLSRFDGLWGAPGSPFESFEGMLRGIAWARVHDVPFLGTCAGFQYALIEFSRNVLRIAHADSAENESGSRNIVITPVACPLPERTGPRLSGTGTARPEPGTSFARLCGERDLRGEYFCSFRPMRPTCRAGKPPACRWQPTEPTAKCEPSSYPGSASSSPRSSNHNSPHHTSTLTP